MGGMVQKIASNFTTDYVFGIPGKSKESAMIMELATTLITKIA